MLLGAGYSRRSLGGCLSEYLNIWNLVSEVEIQNDIQDNHSWRFAGDG